MNRSVQLPTRRHFLNTAALATAALATGRLHGEPGPVGDAPPVHVFSKHLQFLDYEELGTKAAELGFDGVDLTVRPGGHVEPANVTRDLPRAAAALRAAGLDLVLCTTALTTMEDPAAERLLDAIAEAGFRQLRLGWHRYPADLSLPAALEHFKPVAHALATALQQRGLQGAFQNHSGAAYIGASLWELWQILDGIDPAVLGLQFDIRHATAERGLSWPNEFRLAAPKIASLALKDFKWIENPATGRGMVVDTPLSAGWVDWAAYAALLREHALTAPASLHFEYELGGAEHGRRELTLPPETVFEAMRSDLARARRLLS